MKNRQLLKAFTLAETLITLAIIGFIAAITIPSLVNHLNNSQYKTAYKKAVSIASQAMKKGTADNLFKSRTSYYDHVANYENWNVFKSYFNVTKDCNNNNNSQYWNHSGEKSNSTPVDDQPHAFIDSSGMAWSMRGPNTSSVGDTSYILVDTNGFKGPNKYGKDRFVLLFGDKENKSTGIPEKIVTYDDYISPNYLYCPSGECYYKSWLID